MIFSPHSSFFCFNPQPVSFMWRLNANASSGSVSLHVSGDIISPPPLTLRILQFIPQPKE